MRGGFSARGGSAGGRGGGRGGFGGDRGGRGGARGGGRGKKISFTSIYASKSIEEESELTFSLLFLRY